MTSEEGVGAQEEAIRLAEEGSQVENLRQISGCGFSRPLDQGRPSSLNTSTHQAPENNAEWANDLGPSDPVCHAQEALGWNGALLPATYVSTPSPLF